MNNFSVKFLVVAAIFIGLVVGVGAALLQSSKDPGNGSTITTSDSKELDKQELPIEVLKALPPEELAEMYPEKAEAILNPEAFDQVKRAGSDSDDPEYLRAVIQKMGGEAPSDATTKELQDILAGLKVNK